jgi:hypothetical protein
MEGEGQNKNLAHEFDPEMALIKQARDFENQQNQEQGEEIVITNEEIIISNEDDEGKEENEEGGKTILRAKKKKRNYVDYDSNNYNNRKTNTNTKTNTQTKNKSYNNTTTKKTVIQKKDLIYDPNFDYKSNYFYQNISKNDWDKIKSFLRKAFTGQIPSETQLRNFFDEYPNIRKGNVEKLQEVLDEVASEKKKFCRLSKYYEIFLKRIL